MRLRSLLPVLLLCSAVCGSAEAAPKDVPFPLPTPDRSGGAATPTAVPSTAATPAVPANGVAATPANAEDISKQVFGGPRMREDDAFGAYQRGAYLTALSLALPRAQKSDPAAETLIGEIYDQGLGVAEDDAKAAGWYQLAANHGDMLAAFELALLYEQGDGVTKDAAKAAQLFKQSADSGYAPAKYNLALMMMEGLSVAPDLVQAAQLMKQAADTGLSDAQYDYGTMLLNGGGVPPDFRQGALEIGLAAQAGLTTAQVDYATLLYLGKGVSRDLPAAVRWYRQAAEAGNPVAQNRYAKLLAVGEGTDLDLEGAAMWRALARRQGLSDSTLDKLLVSISPDQLAHAEERARFWPSDPPDANATADASPAAAPGPTLPTANNPANDDGKETAADAAATPVPQQNP